MIYSLRKKFIIISAASGLAVFVIIFAALCITNASQLNDAMDRFTDAISQNDGRFPDFKDFDPRDARGSPFGEPRFTPDTQFSIRFFTVHTDQNGNIVRENTEQIASVSKAEAQEIARKAFATGKKRGWISDFRFKVYDSPQGQSVVFVNGETDKSITSRTLYLAAIVLCVSYIGILLLIILISKKAVKPVAESYEKQKQFITDANHELKTPLSVILSNVDILESECGKNEWLQDIRDEGLRMSELIGQLVTLSRMNEDHANLSITEFDFSELAADAVSEFEIVAIDKGKKLIADIEPGITYCGDEGLLRRLMGILLDNAVKYCDECGDIGVFVTAKPRHIVLTVENTYADVDKVDLARIFERFYREDKVRTYSGSYGIGLSVAKSIAEKHRGSIAAYKKDKNHIAFRVTMKK